MTGPVGVVLAGGRSRRMGTPKSLVTLGGRPLTLWALEALSAAGLDRLAVIGKAATPLPPLPAGVERWIEADQPVHPLAGIAAALGFADGPVLVLPVDTPLAPPALLARIAAAPAAPAVVMEVDGRIQPLLGRYAPETAAVLAEAAAGGARATATVASLGPRFLVPAEDERRYLADADDPAELAALELLAPEAGSPHSAG